VLPDYAAFPGHGLDYLDRREAFTAKAAVGRAQWIREFGKAIGGRPKSALREQSSVAVAHGPVDSKSPARFIEPEVDDVRFGGTSAGQIAR
jgi:hypothetical protein